MDTDPAAGPDGSHSGTGPAHPHRARVVQQVRWSDVDLFGHVNNAAFLRYLDDARFSLFPQMGVDAVGVPTASLLVVVKHEIDYLAPLTFRPEPFAVEVWVPRVGRASVDFGYEIVDAAGGSTVYLQARSRMVQLDGATRAAQPFTAGQRAVFAPYQEAAPRLHDW